MSTPSREQAERRGQSSMEMGSVLTLSELAVYLKLAKSTTYKLAQEGKIPGQKVGRHWRFHRNAIDRWLSEQRTKGAQP